MSSESVPDGDSGEGDARSEAGGAVAGPRRTVATGGAEATDGRAARRPVLGYELLALHGMEVVLFVRLDDGQILEANAAAVAAYGYSRGELLARTIFDLRDGSTLGDTRAQLKAAEEHGLVFETVHRRADGSTFPVEVSSCGVDVGGARILVSVVRSIAERKRIEEERARVEAHLKTILDNIVEGVIVTDLDGNPVEWNDAAAEMHGFEGPGQCPRTRAELLAAFEFHAEDGQLLSPAERPTSRILAGERLRDVEVEISRPGTSWRRTFSFAGRLARGPTGTPYVAVVTMRDVTDRLRERRRLAAEREKLAVTLRSIGDAVIATDEHARVTIMNEVASQLTGWEASQAVGRPLGEVFRIVHEETREPAADPVRRVLEEGKVVGLANHTALVSRDGAETPIADSGAPIRDADGQITGVVLVFRDQSGERSARQAVLESEERFRVAFRTIPDAISLSRVDDGRYVAVNDGFTRLLGWSEAELLAGAADEVSLWAHATDRDRLLALLRDRPLVHDFEAELIARDGRVVPVVVSGTIVDVLGQRCLLSVKRDVSERKRADAERQELQAQLRHAAKLEGIGQLAGGIAHDFNNILTVILSGVDDMRYQLAAGTAVSLDLVDEISAAADRARELTNQLLAFARKQFASPVPLDLGAVLHGSKRLLQRILGEDITLTVTSQQGLWRVMCDPGQVEQIVFNLAVNARDAMPNGGTLKVDVSNVAVAGGAAVVDAAGAASCGDCVLLRIEDSGSGMAPEVLEHIFEPFFTTKEPGKGSGLGLASVYGIVKQSGGTISAKSQPHVGTTFEIRLPRTSVAPAAPENKASQRRQAGTERVLLVEDDTSVREVAARALRNAGYRVETTSGVGGALRSLGAREAPALVITDVIMPGQSGWELADYLRRSRPEVRVLFTSGYPTTVIAAEDMAAAGYELLAKPFTPGTLLARVRSILQRPWPPEPSGGQGS